MKDDIEQVREDPDGDEMESKSIRFQLADPAGMSAPALPDW